MFLCYYLHNCRSTRCLRCPNYSLHQPLVNNSLHLIHWRKISKIGQWERSFCLRFRKDKQRVLYRCRYYKIDQANCQWRLQGNVTEEGNIKVTVLVPEHTCIAPLASRSVVATQDWLQIELPRVMEVHRGTQPHDIVNCVKVQFGECIDYKIALRVWNRLASDSLQEHWKASFLYSSDQSNQPRYVQPSIYSK